MNKKSLGFLAALAMVCPCSNVLALGKPAAPNFVIITIDDLQWQSLGQLDAEYTRFTPFLTAYAQESTTFLHSYVPYSLCTPTRAALMTGLNPHRNGVTNHYRSIYTGIQTLPEALKSTGYFTGLIGKVRHTLVERQDSLDEIVGPDRLRLGRSPEHFQTETRKFIASANGRPFMVNINIHDPHTPYPGADKTDRWKSYLQYLTDRSGLSSILRSRRLEYQGTPPSDSVLYEPSEVPVYPFIPDIPAAREEMTQILTAVQRADKTVKAIITALIQAGVADNTVVFIFSDNGAALPFSKEDVYPNSIRAGLIVHVPWLANNARFDRSSLVSINDIYPTVLEMADIDFDTRSIDGKSLASLLGGSGEPGFRDYLTGYFFGSRPKRSITDGNLWYMWQPWADGKTQAQGHFISSMTFAAMRQVNDDRYRSLMYRTVQELYDVNLDPNALQNLVFVPGHDSDLQRMRLAMLDYMERDQDPMLDEFRAFLQQRQGLSGLEEPGNGQ